MFDVDSLSIRFFYAKTRISRRLKEYMMEVHYN